MRLKAVISSLLQGGEADLGAFAKSYERQLTDLVDSTIPRLTRLAEARAGDFLRSHNLTHVSRDLELLYFSVWVAGNCSSGQREKLAAEAARARLEAQR